MKFGCVNVGGVGVRAFAEDVTVIVDITTGKGENKSVGGPHRYLRCR
jgi:hypothetical protein